MADSEKRWYQVTASLKVLARDRDEAAERFWNWADDIEEAPMDSGFFQVRSIDECEPDAEGE